MVRLVTIERKKLDANGLYGVVIAQSAALTLLHQEIDFQFDGYMVMRTRDITRCDPSESGDYCRRLMRLEGLWKTAPRWVRKLSIGGWPELVSDLVGRVVIVEDEVRETFHIGPLLEAQSKHALIHHFDPCGRLQEVNKVAYSRITAVRFGDRYSTIHSRYLSADGRPAPRKTRLNPAGTLRSR
jgi:hypothetical protein